MTGGGKTNRIRSEIQAIYTQVADLRSDGCILLNNTDTHSSENATPPHAHDEYTRGEKFH